MIAAAPLLALGLAAAAPADTAADRALTAREARFRFPAPARLAPALAAIGRAARCPAPPRPIAAWPAAGDPGLLAAILTQGARGGWVVVAGGCGPLLQLRLIARSDGGLDLAPFARGAGLAWPSLVAEALPMARAAAATLLPHGCPDARRTDGHIVAIDPGLAPRRHGIRATGGWREAWRLEGCGGAASIPLDFVALGRGQARVHLAYADARRLPLGGGAAGSPAADAYGPVRYGR
ncbi:hypothetical protein [Sphingomonas morindae]|uniref:Uncharacterized protein n=1 Tax=Sphingomonas morindae TaxID=1541170 RepID=A0ABY4XC33_9SPHN|nr:hypothetical protein [Sphingomonas morindae]USI74444.1 hypothetical protein LHA26_08345 [Sphingomonas morindae]